MKSSIHYVVLKHYINSLWINNKIIPVLVGTSNSAVGDGVTATTKTSP